MTSQKHPNLSDRILYPLTEARQLLGGIGKSSFYKLVGNGQISVVKVGNRTFVHADELVAFVKRVSSPE